MYFFLFASCELLNDDIHQNGVQCDLFTSDRPNLWTTKYRSHAAMVTKLLLWIVCCAANYIVIFCFKIFFVEAINNHMISGCIDASVISLLFHNPGFALMMSNSGVKHCLILNNQYTISPLLLQNKDHKHNE